MGPLDEKNLVSHIWPIPFIMDPKFYDFGLKDTVSQDLNKLVYKARLEYMKKCADAESEMLGKVLDFLKRHRI